MSQTMRSILTSLILILALTHPALARPSPSPPSQPVTPYWDVAYWNNTSLSGEPAVRTTDRHLDHDWGLGAPHPGIDPDRFSARWAGTVELTGGRYRFTAVADDGIRVYVDGVLIIDEWYDHPRYSFTSETELPSGATALRSNTTTTSSLPSPGSSGSWLRLSRARGTAPTTTTSISKGYRTSAPTRPSTSTGVPGRPPRGFRAMASRSAGGGPSPSAPGHTASRHRATTASRSSPTSPSGTRPAPRPVMWSPTATDGPHASSTNPSPEIPGSPSAPTGSAAMGRSAYPSPPPPGRSTVPASSPSTPSNGSPVDRSSDVGR